MKVTSLTSFPTPELIWDTINAYQKSAAIKAGVELELFTAIGEGRAAARPLAERCQASERGIRILCDYLVVTGLLTKQDGQYGLKPDSAAFLDRRSPAYIGDCFKFLLSPMLTDRFKDIAACVRKGGTVTPKEGTTAPDHPMWVEFARSMAGFAVPIAQGIAELLDASSGYPMKVLDVAAGHGLYGIEIAKRNPNARIVALDWANVLQVAKENAAASGVGGRYELLAGDAMNVDLGDDYDLVLVTNFLHHFDLRTCEDFMRKVHAALKKDGRAVTVEFIPNEDRVTPPIAATFSMMMLGGTPAGDAHTFSEYDRIFKNAGFDRNELRPIPMSPTKAIISHK